MSKPKSANATGAAEATAPVKSYNMSLFTVTEKVAAQLAKAKRLTTPPVIMLADFPIWSEATPAILVGEVVKGIDSPSSTVKGACLWLVKDDGSEVLLPVTGSIRNCLAPDAKADSAELITALTKLKGKSYAFKRLASSNANAKKEQYLFDVLELA